MAYGRRFEKSSFPYGSLTDRHEILRVDGMTHIDPVG